MRPKASKVRSYVKNKVNIPRKPFYFIINFFVTIWMIIHFNEMPINTKKVVLYADWLILKQIVSCKYLIIALFHSLIFEDFACAALFTMFSPPTGPLWRRTTSSLARSPSARVWCQSNHCTSITFSSHDKSFHAFLADFCVWIWGKIISNYFWRVCGCFFLLWNTLNLVSAVVFLLAKLYFIIIY